MAVDAFSFFDPEKSQAAKQQKAKTASNAPLTVTALIAQIKNALAQAFPRRVAVIGEISNFKLHSSGHMYFRLKDANCAIDAAMFRSAASKLKFTPTDGMEVIVEGRADVYDARGQLQLYAEKMTPKGQGALELAFQQLRQKLQAEGLFDPSHKKPIARFPRAIGVVTSPTGAAIRDIRRTLARRWPAAKVYLVPALVQGDGAAQSVAQAIQLLDANAAAYEIDTLIVARGGGSLEDLWAFNEEPVARAVFAARTPIISGVGHEIDVSICDMVADIRAATPTAAAEIAVPDGVELKRFIAALAGRLNQQTRQRLHSAKTELQSLMRSVVFRDPMAILRVRMQRSDELAYRLRTAAMSQSARGRNQLNPLANRLAALHPARLAERAQSRLEQALSRLAWSLGGQAKRSGDRLGQLEARLLAASPIHRLKLARQQIDAAARQLEAMSYRAVLQRGFSVTRDSQGQILRSIQNVTAGDTIATELADGTFHSTVSQQDPLPADKRTAPAPKTKTPKQKREKPSVHSGPGLFDSI